MPARRAPLTRERAVQAATALADEHGLAALTMRALAERLGVRPMAVYHHVPHKDALLGLLVEEVLGQVAPPPPGAPWREALGTRCRSAREVLRAHPWALVLLESRRTPGPTSLEHHDAVLGTLLGAGFDVPAAGHAYALLDAFVYGFVLQESTLPFDDAHAPEVADEIVAAVPEGAYPHLVRFARERVREGYAFGDEFEVGLRLVLDAVASLHPGATDRAGRRTVDA
ncbi:TetR/AcrR family transcriptional regulator [Cellulomonas oligotrophica]|uniref:AcrR family transcriptional regulator n=1 Tax=Cellulomonas oligotrophica TaxID=931536 RepID=A0A7Y9FD69_9CELL|nr:TetR/AcrR family transcriptional regulator [Cellulomonas oligotrophica]NYD85135.1 AcrR family transcriptional regulator [Cellulomonas oligotrophica]GIG33839.1 TetR family transcriptional regulator [Cellulomonas oligotrophica]